MRSDHLLILIIILAVSLILVAIARKSELKFLIRPVNWFLAIMAVSHEIAWIVWAAAMGIWHHSWGIPLQLCDLAVFAVALVLIKHYQWVWELAYFWGLGGSLQAILTPEITLSFPDIEYIKFFLSHGIVVAGVIYLAAGLKRQIFAHSIVRVFIITNIYGLFVLVFNKLAGTNYMYLIEKPTQPSVLDYAGEGIFYFFGLEFLLILSLIAYYTPYFIVHLVKKRN